MTEVHGFDADSQNPQGAADGGKYVYCIIRSDRQRDFGAIGIGGGQKVATVAYKDLAAVVSDTPIVIYDPTRENVLAHEFVNETVLREYTVIPMPFGDRMFLTAAFLADRALEQSSDYRVKETSRRYEELLTFKYSGPWPPYN